MDLHHGLLAGPSRPAAAQRVVTFNKDIAPIVFEHCAPCHRPGEIGPFALLNYDDARKHATQIALVTERRVMPPWKPEPGKGEFIGDRSLTSAQIRLIHEWVASGGKEGDPADLPPVPQWTSGWQLGTPDLAVSMPEAYMLRADGPDVFRTFVIPIPAPTSRYVKAVEFHPGNPRAVHHANLGADRTGSSRRRDRRDPEPGYLGGMVPDAAYPAGFMLGWTPGQRPRPSPDGMSWRLERESDLVVQLHMQPTGKPEAVLVSVGFFFTEEPPSRTPVGLRLGSETIEIAAGDRHYAVIDSYRLPVDVEVLAIQPHAHNLARRMEASATLPDGSTRPLISIPDWDFRWQDVYRYSRPFVLPAGTTLSMRFTYDNSADNPRNPGRPPRAVVWGQDSWDEMGDLWVQVVPRTSADLAVLGDDIGRKTRTEDLAAYTKLLDGDPKDPLRHDAVAILYLQGGRVQEAAVHFRESLRLNPESAPAHYNLGTALSLQRRFDDAVTEFREAVHLDPDHAEAHNNLGAMLHVSGRLDEAAEHYRRAITLRPDNAQAQNNLGRLLSQQGRQAEAIACFRRALALDPDFAAALYGLAWIRATSDSATQDAKEAVRLAERADALTQHRDPPVLDVLAAAYAAAGLFERAVATARSAAAAATSAQMSSLASDIRKRLALYELRQPYLVKP
jgi:Flp pilus assembly protein TadD